MQVQASSVAPRRYPPAASGASIVVRERSKVKPYKTEDVEFLEGILRRRIRDRVVEIGVSQAHALVRRRKPRMAGRRLSSIYSVKNAELAISLRELIATLSALDDDPLEAIFNAIARRRKISETNSRRAYYRNLEQLRDEVVAQQKRPRRQAEPAEDPPLLRIMEAA